MLAVCGFLRCFFHLNHSPRFLDFHQPVNYRQSCSMECQPVASLYCILSPLQQRHPLRSSLQHIYSFLLHQIAAFSLPSLFTDQQMFRALQDNCTYLSSLLNVKHFGNKNSRSLHLSFPCLNLLYFSFLMQFIIFFAY